MSEQITSHVQEAAKLRSKNVAKAKFYVDGKKLYQTLVDYKKAINKAKREKLPPPPMPNYLGDAWSKMAWGILKYPQFATYPYAAKQEFVQDACENCVRYCDRFNPRKSKYAFSYFSLLILRSFFRSIAKEKKYLYVKYKETIRQGALEIMEQISAESGQSSGELGLQTTEIYDNIHEFVYKFEASKKLKKEKAAQKKIAAEKIKKRKKGKRR